MTDPPEPRRSRETIQREHDLAELHMALIRAQHRAEMCDWPEMARSLRRHREEAAARLLSAGGKADEFRVP